MSQQRLAWLSELDIRSRNLPVLLVEGKDDVLIYRSFLTQIDPNFETRLTLLEAGDKRHVIQALKERTTWFGLIDRDEWLEADVHTAQLKQPRLCILPRYCVESYFCDPLELWAAIPASKQARYPLGSKLLTESIELALPDWVAHGAMWRTLRELYHRTKLPNDLEDRPITNLAQVRDILARWHAQLDPETVIADYTTELSRAQMRTSSQQLHHYVHGKKFFNQVVVQKLDTLFSGKGRDQWLESFYNAPMFPPHDLRQFLVNVLAYFSQNP